MSTYRALSLIKHNNLKFGQVLDKPADQSSNNSSKKHQPTSNSRNNRQQ